MNWTRFEPAGVGITERATTLLQEFGRTVQDLGDGIVKVETDLGFAVHAVEIGRTLLVLTGSLDKDQTTKLLAHAATVGWRARNGHRIPVHVHASGQAIHLTAE